MARSRARVRNGGGFLQERCAQEKGVCDLGTLGKPRCSVGEELI